MTGSHKRIACRDPIARDGDDNRFSFHPDGFWTYRRRCSGFHSELVYQISIPTEAVNRELFTYTKGYYNRRSVDSALGHIMPEQAERKAA